MKVIIHSIHFTAAEKLKSYVQKKCEKLNQFYDRITDATVRLKLQNEVKGANKLVEITLGVPGDTLIATEKGSTFEEATDLATDKLKTQLKKYKGKLRTRTS